MMTRFVLPLLVTLLVAASAWAQGEVAVKRQLFQAGVTRVLGAKLAPEQKDAKFKEVVVKLLVTYPKCTSGEIFWFNEGDFSGFNRISLWAADTPGSCPKGKGVKVEHHMKVEKGKDNRLVYAGAARFDYKLTFKATDKGVEVGINRKQKAR